MDVVLPLDRRTTGEKVQLMEKRWDDLVRSAASLDSPAWHEDVLRERDRRVAIGEETYISWEQAKQQLRERLQ